MDFELDIFFVTGKFQNRTCNAGNFADLKNGWNDFRRLANAVSFLKLAVFQIRRNRTLQNKIDVAFH